MAITFRNRTVSLQPILLGLGFALLVGIIGAIFFLVRQSDADSRSVVHTVDVQEKLSNLLLSVRRVESGQRGYLLTGRETYLQDYSDGMPEIVPLSQDVRRLLLDNPERTAAIDEIQALIRDKLSELEQTISIYNSGDKDGALRLVLTDRGRAVMNRLRELVDKTIAAEGELLNQRTRITRDNNTRLLTVTSTGAALMILIGGLSVFLVQRSNKERELAQQEFELTNANLETIVTHRTADLTEANEEIQRFAYIVSHDLRSPLVNIMGFTTELEALRTDIFDKVKTLQAEVASLNAASDGGKDETVETLGKDFDEAVGFIKTSISRMDRLINAVLKLSREGRREFNPEQIDTSELLTAINRSVAHRADDLGATITIDTVPAVQSDRLALEQIFGNLIDNALKYLRNDTPGIIRVTGRANGPLVIYDVTDNGRGIDPNDHQRVFELFRRSGVQDRPGEGIGLAHVRALVRRLGGSLSLTSELGKGSTFTVTLPRRWKGETRSVA